MGVIDREIDLINEGITEVHRALYRVDRHMEGVAEQLDRALSEFEDAVRSVETQVKDVRTQIISVTDQFPDDSVYLWVLLFVDLVVWILAGFLVYRIVVAIRSRNERSLQFQKKSTLRRVYAKNFGGDSVVLQRFNDDSESQSFLSLNSSRIEERKTLLAVYREPLRSERASNLWK